MAPKRKSESKVEVQTAKVSKKFDCIEQEDSSARFQRKGGDSRTVIFTIPGDRDVLRVYPWKCDIQGFWVEFSEKGYEFSATEVKSMLEVMLDLKRDLDLLQRKQLTGVKEVAIGPEGLVASLHPKYPCLNIRRKWWDCYSSQSRYSKTGVALRLKTESNEFLEAIQLAGEMFDLTS